MIEKVISGGQIGADIAGLRAAKKRGIATGGYAPAGFKTLQGPKPQILRSFGLVDCGEGYARRTALNVLFSDGTIRLAENFNTPGERSTLNAIQRHRKPFFDVPIRIGGGWKDEFQPFWAAKWVVQNDIKVLNVAGNGKLDLEPIVETYIERLLIILAMNDESLSR